MTIAREHRTLRNSEKQFAIPRGQFNGLAAILLFGCLLLVVTLQEALFVTVLLYSLVAVGGLLLCRRTQLQLADPKLEVLGYFWLFKVALTLFLLYVAWMPQLNPNSSNWGYDPQRYFYQARELIGNHWSPDFTSLNYVGILYFYAGISFVFGNNPVIPALINILITLIALLYLIKTAYEIRVDKGQRDWTIAFALLLPEFLWFDVMTSREMLMSACLLISLLTVGRYLVNNKRISFLKVAVTVGVCMGIIAAIRTSMLVPLVVAIEAMLLVLIDKRRVVKRTKRLFIGVSVILTMMIGQVINTVLGGYKFGVQKAMETATIASMNTATDVEMAWSKNSIGVLLLPNGLMQSILFLPPRMILYIVSPLPNNLVTIDGIINGEWVAWQGFFVELSSVLNIVAFPYILGSLIHSIKYREKYNMHLIFLISYFVLLTAVAGGNLIIHERYRIMATGMFWGCAWLGARTCPKSLIHRSMVCWYSLLLACGVFYVLFKNMV